MTIQNLFTPSNNTKKKHQKLILNALHLGPVTTLYAREKLGIQGVAPRILELRRAGWLIATRRRRVFDEHGRVHSVAEYALETIGGESEGDNHD